MANQRDDGPDETSSGGPFPFDPDTAETTADVEAVAESIDVERRALASPAGPSGSLKDEPAPDLLHRMYAEGLSGALYLANKRVKKIVYLRDGYPVSVKSNVTGECLGKILTWEGLITAEQFLQSLRDMEASGVRQGSALIRMGALTHRQLSNGLELQLRFKLCETFAWTRGRYGLWRGVDPPFESVPLSMAPAGLIYQGIRSFVPQPQLLALLKKHATSYLAPSLDPLLRFQDLAPPEEALELLNRIDGTTTVGELMRSSPLQVVETAALLHALITLRITTPRENPAPEPQPLFDPAVRPDLPTEGGVPGDSRRRVELAKLVARLRTSSPTEVLEVEPDADTETLRVAFEERAMERHPDRSGASLGQGIRGLAVNALALTAEAYATLVGSAASVDTKPHTPSNALIEDEVRGIVDAEGYHKEGLALIDRGQPGDAVPVLSRAVAACEHEGDFRASLAWAIFQAGLDDSAAVQSLTQLDEAVLRSPGLVRAHVYRGHVLRFLDRREDAARAFEEALRRDPENTEASSELERIRETDYLRSSE